MNVPIARHQGPPWPALSALSASMAALLVEEAIGMVGLWLWGMTGPGPEPGSEEESGALFVLFGLPLLAGVAAVAALLLTLVLVLPAVSLAGRAARRHDRPDAWWWLPATAAGVTGTAVAAAGTVTAVLRGGPAGPLAYAAWWLGLLVLALPACYLTRLDRRRTAQGRTPASLARTVLTRGCAGVALCTSAVLVGVVAAGWAFG
ncbi:hypothetical protein [Streptomyces huiliensis]|uniref:hypothetical protein n=1 Tax=Streptomyces huiliensis TaxID=2876027 RepID=UPI001CC15838|nr:hypothetical protein [Streptomyces huiliensis]MBZ4324314.1 hypothetical protein [Streptomyces huiliensis]